MQPQQQPQQTQPQPTPTRNDVAELRKEVAELREDVKVIRDMLIELTPKVSKMDQHVDFVESVCNDVAAPIGRLCHKVGITAPRHVGIKALPPSETSTAYDTDADSLDFLRDVL